MLMSNHDPILKKHLFVIGFSPENAKYTSGEVQNELIDIMSHDTILTGITSKVKDAQFYSIMADEVTTHCVEELALCLRYVDDNKDVQEDFVGFIRLPRITGEVIATQILNQLEALGLDPAKIRGQGYEGPSNMSSDNVGVQARIKEKSPKAAFIHCSGHCLNLVISHSCQVLGIRNAIDKIQAVYLFFSGSPKRTGLLTSTIEEHSPLEGRRKALLELCKTRWAARHDAYSHSYQAYVYIVKSLEMISMNEAKNGYDAWDPKSRSSANSLVQGITSFEFIVNFLTAYIYLSHLEGVTVKLQGRTVDIITAHRMVCQINISKINAQALICTV